MGDWYGYIDDAGPGDGHYRHIGWNYKNPSVHEGTDGSLEVRIEGKRLGRYPTGAWLSWRSD